MESKNVSLKDLTRIKIMEAFAQLVGGISQLERRLDQLENSIENVDQRTLFLHHKIQTNTTIKSNEDFLK